MADASRTFARFARQRWFSKPALAAALYLGGMYGMFGAMVDYKHRDIIRPPLVANESDARREVVRCCGSQKKAHAFLEQMQLHLTEYGKKARKVYNDPDSLLKAKRDLYSKAWQTIQNHVPPSNLKDRDTAEVIYTFFPGSKRSASDYASVFGNPSAYRLLTLLHSGSLQPILPDYPWVEAHADGTHPFKLDYSKIESRYEPPVQKQVGRTPGSPPQQSPPPLPFQAPAKNPSPKTPPVTAPVQKTPPVSPSKSTDATPLVQTSTPRPKKSSSPLRVRNFGVDTSLLSRLIVDLEIHLGYTDHHEADSRAGVVQGRLDQWRDRLAALRKFWLDKNNTNLAQVSHNLRTLLRKYGIDHRATVDFLEGGYHLHHNWPVGHLAKTPRELPPAVRPTRTVNRSSPARSHPRMRE